MRYVYCHGLFDERKCGHRFSYELAKKMAEFGLFLERFDYKGTGEAKGEFCDITVEKMTDDLANFVNGERCVLIGVRVGAVVAVRLAMREEHLVEKIILVEPVMNGKAYLEHILRKQQIKDAMTGNERIADDKGYENIEGYKANRKLLEQLAEIDIRGDIGNLETNKKIITSDKNLVLGNCEIIKVKRLAFWERIGHADYGKLIEIIKDFCFGKERVYKHKGW